MFNPSQGIPEETSDNKAALRTGQIPVDSPGIKESPEIPEAIIFPKRGQVYVSAEGSGSSNDFPN
ncbi:hypothetical protein EG328_004340 [Venturia inaequalis]|uniref:Uncharacterized protein n=1 Tax=Venturia inaequalis TaxID=5025 RepID=A0A8H3VH27_VENIN|nr:hypothetical protein EG328_004340 [Venturia inaequalis]